MRGEREWERVSKAVVCANGALIAAAFLEMFCRR